MTDTSTHLPPGAHPFDQSGPPEFTPAHPEAIVDAQPAGPELFPGRPGTATPVWERSSGEWTGMSWQLNQTTLPYVQAARRLKGRRSVTVWVSSSYTTGVWVARTQDAAQAAAAATGGAGLFGFPLNPGDSVTIESEAPVYIGLQPGKTTGQANVMTLNNPLTPEPD